MPRTCVNDRLVAIGMLRGGMTYTDVARRFGVTRQSVALWRRRYQQNNGNVRDLPRQGRPRVTNPQQDRFIRVQHLRNRFHPATVTARTIPGLRRICPRVMNRLKEHMAFDPFKRRHHFRQ
ncbi:hypothetical protein V1264_001967 [Littorina saxatilis]|uniref:Uncharacterized protein n=1 Tax=Littorina saxatilis TaxID=31220 RepID=A0AAN9GQD6_9CAEN